MQQLQDDHKGRFYRPAPAFQINESDAVVVRPS
jgi:hypothetical protein